ncbi:MAG: VWA domain-containing protein, partial [Chloroflexota bacterium]|nr:VWA domain-containing protein [Chloroflexota bacterium]
MPPFRFGARYSRWDGTQQISPLDADELMRALSDDLMQNGDLDLALQRLFRWGFERGDGEHVPGLREMLQRLKERRQDQLSRYDLGSVLEDVQRELQEIVAAERAGIENRLEEGRRRLEAQPASGAPEANQGGKGAQEADGAGEDPGGERGQASGGQEQAGGEGQESGGTGSGSKPGGSGEPYDADLHKLLEQMAARKLDQLGGLPSDPGGMIRELHEYEFMDPEARRRFQELLAMLQQQVLQSTFQGMQQALGQMTPEDIGEMRQMMRDLNEMLEARQRGEDPNFQEFMHKWGHFFGPGIE